MGNNKPGKRVFLLLRMANYSSGFFECAGQFQECGGSLAPGDQG
jgi:hypothetical protein